MSQNSVPRFANTKRVWQVQISTSNTNLDGTGTMGVLVPATTNGAIINRFIITATVTTTGGMIRIFINDAVNKRLVYEVDVTAITPSATVKAFTAELAPNSELVLPDTFSIEVSTESAETFNVFALGGEM